MSDAAEFAEVTQLLERWLTGRPLAERSRREYARNVRAYWAWLAETPDRGGWQGDPLTDPLARDFRRYLQVEKRAAASTVNLALASLDALHRCLGLGRPHVRRGKPVQAAPRAVDEAGQRRLLRAAEAAPVRARALVMLMLFTALRISETVALDVDDVRITARKGVLVVVGKGEIQREVPLNALVRQVLEEWLEQRTVLAADRERALWVSRTGGRLSAPLGRARRARIAGQLKKGETLHALRRHLVIGSRAQIPADEDHHRHALCLQILVNTVQVWNARYMTASIDHLHATKPDVVADETPIARVAPVTHAQSTRWAATTSTAGRRRKDVCDRCAASLTTTTQPS